TDPSGAPSGSTPSPQGGGVIRFGIVGEPATLDPYSPLASHLTYALVRPVYRSLYRFEPDGTPVADLVESIETEGRRTVVRLVPAEWSDGSAITARDVRATWRRARAPSGWRAVARLRVLDERTVELTGDASDWPRALARLTFVLPGGRPRPAIAGGPFRIAEITRGLRYVYEPNPRWDGPAVLPQRVVVTVVERLEILLALLERGSLDGAWPPVGVNLRQRLTEMGLESESALGWELVYLDLSGSPLSADQRFGLYGLIDRARLDSGLVRDGGRIAHQLKIGPQRINIGQGRGPAGSVPVGATLQLAVPVGDELLEFVQRVLQRDFAKAGVRLEMVTIDTATFYGAWRRDDPIDLALRRHLGAPGLRPEERVPDALPLWHMKSLLAWRSGVHGLRVNPTVEGPLWNASEWWIDRSR
ncbi:MAG TPA: ABC transporter substrate-binding protein, partial [Actinomycetota bacterium]|nr:ABC transporter substrate-binding protein [Actinomycetota bacterium]